MKTIVTIKGRPVIEIYESFNGNYWFITEKCHKQDSVIDGKVYEDDQILFGYARLAACPEFAEFGYISETELRLLGNRAWKVPERNWHVCPEVEVQEVFDRTEAQTAIDREEQPSRSGFSRSSNCKEVNEKMDFEIQEKLDTYLDLLDEIRQRTGDDETAKVLLSEIAEDLRREKARQERSANRDAPATENQVAYLKDLRAVIPEGLTRGQASRLIDATKAGRSQARRDIEAPIRI